MADEIEVSLFTLLEEASQLLEDNEKVEDIDERIMNFHKIENKLEAFIENFFLQLFYNGFELEIDGITEGALSQVEGHFSDFKGIEIPENIIKCFQIAIETVLDIETAVYLDPPRNDDLYDAYLDFLPKLFESYKRDEAVLKDRIENYGVVNVRMDGILVMIGKLKKQKRLT